MLENSLRVLRRRWGLALLAVLAACAAAGSTFALVPPVQQSKAAVLFVPSIRQPGVEGPTNPLLELGGSVAVVASVVQIAVTDDQTSLELAAAGQTAKFEVVPDLGENAGPVLLVTAEDPDRDVARSTRDALVDRISEELERLQDSRGVSSDLRVTSVLLTSSPKAVALHKDQIQLAAVAGGSLLAALLLLLLLVDRRRDVGHHRAVDQASDSVEPRDTPSTDALRQKAPDSVPERRAVLTGRTAQDR